MKLINKKTGQIAVFGEGIVNLQEIGCKNVAEMLEAGWEDYQEHESFWYISSTGTPIKSTTSIYDPLEIHLMKRIGNYFESEEDAEMAVQKLGALKRLKDKGFRFDGYGRYHWTGEEWPHVAFSCPNFDDLFDDSETVADLDSLFNDDEDGYEPTNAEINDLTDMGYGG